MQNANCIISFWQASTYQMALLLQFNTATEHTVAHLQACTQLKEVNSWYMVHTLYVTWFAGGLIPRYYQIVDRKIRYGLSLFCYLYMCIVNLASSPGHSQILSCSRGETTSWTGSFDPRPSPDISPQLQDKIWEWPGDEANSYLVPVSMSNVSSSHHFMHTFCA